MESHVAATEPLVIDGLQYKLKPNGEYVTKRESVTFHPSGSNVYQPVGGTRVLRIVISDGSGAWLDPETVKLQFDVINTDTDAAKRLRPIAPWCFFKKIRISASGALIEDFDYARTHEMFHMMKSKELRENDQVEGFEFSIDDTPSDGNYAGIAGADGKKTVCFSLLSGLLSCGKMLPLSYMKGGLTIELELANSYADALVTAQANTLLTTANTSELWRIENAQIKADILTLDNGFQNSYDSHMLDGGMLAINYMGYITSQQSITGTNVTVNLSRQSSHLKGVFVSYFNAAGQRHKEANQFYHPMSMVPTYGAAQVEYTYDADYELEFQLQVGGKSFPQMPINSVAESWAQLRKAVAAYGKHPLSTKAREYHSTKFVQGLDLEKLSGVGYTGLSTKNGEMITVKVKAVNTTTLNTHMPTSLFMVLCTDNILQISDSGVSALD